MTQLQYIEEVARLVKKYAPQYGIKVYSPIIAQFCLESGYGTTNKVMKVLEDGTVDWRHNYVGLKWRDGRCAISNEYFEESTSEQNPDKSYVGIVAEFYRFKSLEECVIGYFQFTDIPNYANLKGVTDPETYLKNIKADQYATSIDYVQKNMNVINKWNLTKYDNKVESNKNPKVAIDAGHGSNTAGKRSPDGYREHWINVKTANYLNIALIRCGIDTVKIGWDDTNSTDDTDVSLTTRQTQIKSAECDISVSVHANAHGTGNEFTTGQGIETFIHTNDAYIADSLELANKVQSYLIKGTQQKNRGVKRQALSMCNCPKMGTKASILTEVGFMTNEYELSLLKNDAFCLECAEEIAQGVCAYLGVTYKAGNTNIAVTTPVTTKTAPFKIDSNKKAIQRYLNEYYGEEIKQVVGALLVIDGSIGSKSKKALAVAIQVELNKLGAGLDVDGSIGAKSDRAFDKYVGVLKKGMKNNIFVTLWQCILVGHNIDPNGIDGSFGGGCVSATNTLFTKIGLSKDSSVSGADLNALL